jgi:DNA transposition AAA+ family ATPase
MSETAQIIKPPTSFAALKNVIGFYELVRKLQDRLPTLPNIGVMYGDSGIGKSYAAIYAANKTRAIRVEVLESWTRKVFLTAILHEGGCAETRGSVAELAERACALLAENPKRPLFVDEADKCVDKGWVELVRELAMHSNAPVLLIGEELLPSKLQRIERVHNRVLDWFGAERCDLADCSELAKIFLPNVAIADDLLDKIRIAGDGRARRIVVTLNKALEESRKSNLRALTLENYKGEIYTGQAPRARGVPSRLKNGRAA